MEAGKISAGLCINWSVHIVCNFTYEGVSYLGGYLPTGISFHLDFFMVFSWDL